MGAARRLRHLLAAFIILAFGSLTALAAQPAGVVAHDPAPEEHLQPVEPVPADQPVASNQSMIADQPVAADELVAADEPVDLPTGTDERSQTVLGGYRTVEASYAWLDAWESAYPSLAAGFTYGVSWDKLTPGGPDGYDLRGITITNQFRPGPKPAFVLVAAMHPREMVTTELALRFTEYLLTHYGEDPDVTWLLDEHQVVVLPIANPDGRKDAEQGVLQRKNKNVVDGPCLTDPPTALSQPGVDLNRGFGFHWEDFNLPARDPCAQTFGGSSPESEPEVAALASRLEQMFLTRRGPDLDDPAPDTTEGIVISLHAYSNLVMWPWSFREDPAPNGADLAGLGRKLATYNGYRALQIPELYPASGTLEDWVYGTFGVPTFTFEVGPADEESDCSGFIPAYACLDDEPEGRFWDANRPALLYAAKVARAPYLLHRGPDALQVTASAGPDGYLVDATIDDAKNGHQAIAAAEMYLGTPPSRGGRPIALAAADGAYDSSREEVTGAFDPPVPSGRHLVYVRGQDALGNWGPVSAAWLSVLD